MNLIDVSELNILWDICDRLEAEGLSMTATQLRSFVRNDLRPLSTLDQPIQAGYGTGQSPLKICCYKSDCKTVTRVLFNIAREYEKDPIWSCEVHIPEGIFRPGLPHPKIRDVMLLEAWRNYFKREERGETQSPPSQPTLDQTD